MPEVKRTVRFITRQQITKEATEPDAFPERAWSIEIYVLGPNGEQLPANCFEKVTYKLHESFVKPNQTFKEPPFRIDEAGWGEFVMTIALTPYGNPKGGETMVQHDLNFEKEEYISDHPNITFRNPKADLAERLRESGPVGENGPNKTVGLKKKGNKNIDMEKLATGLEKLDQDDLLHVVQLIHDNKTEDTYTKNDTDQGEFHVDLCTLPDALIKMLWDFVCSKVDIATL